MPAKMFTDHMGELGAAVGAAFLAFLQSPATQSSLSALKIISIIVSIIILTLITTLVVRTSLLSKIKERHYQWYLPSKPSAKKIKIKEIWNKTKDKFEKSTNPLDWRVAIIAADNILFIALGELGASGSTLGERLRYVTPAEIRNLGDVVSAHKEAVFLKQNPQEAPIFERASYIINSYGLALRELGLVRD